MRKILIVDDDAPTVETLRKRLEVNSYQPIVASQSKEILEKVKKERPELILLDLILTNENGYDTCRMLKTNPETRDIPLLILTVRADTEMKVKVLDAGADDYITKPYDHQELLARIRAVLRGRGEKKKLMEEEKLTSSGQIAKEIAGAISNPLQRISERAEYLLAAVQKGKAPLDLLTDSLQIIQREVRRIKLHNSNLLKLNHYAKFGFRLIPDLNQTIENSLRFLRNDLEENEIRIKKELSPEFLPVIGNERELQQVFINLILSLQESTGDGGELTISTFLKGEEVEVKFVGIGCSGKGFPLVGLAVAKEIIIQHQGSFEEEKDKLILNLPLSRK